MEKTILTKQQIIQKILFESTHDSQDIWGWVSPNNEIYKVPRLKHASFIMPKYRHVSTWDNDLVFDQAFKDGWVRFTYEYFPNQFLGSLSVSTYDEERAKNVIKEILLSYIKYGNNTVFIDVDKPNLHYAFTTMNSVGKYRLFNYLGINTNE